MRVIFSLLLTLAVLPTWAQTSIGEAVQPILPGIAKNVIRDYPRFEGNGDLCSLPFQAPRQIPWECAGSPPFPPGYNVRGPFTIGSDAAGNAYLITDSESPMSFGDGTHGHLLRRVTPNGVTEDVARIVEGGTGLPTHFFTGAVLDVTNGTIWVKLYSDTSLGIVELSGFPTLFEILQTYDPGTTDFGFRVPAHPEGLEHADWFDTYHADLSTVGDWSQLQPLQCAYPASPPTVGDYLMVADTVPTPSPGQGVYYLTAATFMGETRIGRKASGGQLSGRDPSTLPTCE